MILYFFISSFWKDRVNDTDFKIKSFEQDNQDNGYDCGTYVCKYYEDLIANKQELRFPEKELPEYRRKIELKLRQTSNFHLILNLKYIDYFKLNF